MRLFYCRLNCVVAIILIINSAHISAAPIIAGRPSPSSRSHEQPGGADLAAAQRPSQVSNDEVQSQLNKYFTLGKKLKDWKRLETLFNINHIVFMRFDDTPKTHEKAFSFKKELEKKGLHVTVAERPADIQRLRELCRRQPSEPNRLLISDHMWFLREVYNPTSGCVVAYIAKPKTFFQDFKLSSVPILIKQADLDTFVEEGRAKFGKALAERLARGGSKVVIVVFKDTIIAGNDLKKPWPESFVNFANDVHEQGLLLYIENSGFEALERKAKSFHAKFFVFRAGSQTSTTELLDLESPLEIVWIDKNRENVERQVHRYHLGIHFDGDNGFDLGALKPADVPPEYSPRPIRDLSDLPPAYATLHENSLPSPRQPPPPYPGVLDMV